MKKQNKSYEKVMVLHILEKSIELTLNYLKRVLLLQISSKTILIQKKFERKMLRNICSKKTAIISHFILFSLVQIVRYDLNHDTP